MRPLATLVSLAPRQDYDGTELRPHFLRTRFGVKGDAIVAFRGACSVVGRALVDLEDRLADDVIRSHDMIHFIVERFGADLPEMVFLQRLVAALAADRLRAGLDPARAATVRRDGDDVFVGDGKLSVSIATVSPVSGLVHFAVNIDDRDTPVRTAALGPLGFPPEAFASGLVSDVAREIDTVIDALCKVSPAHGDGGAGR